MQYRRKIFCDILGTNEKTNKIKYVTLLEKQVIPITPQIKPTFWWIKYFLKKNRLKSQKKLLRRVTLWEFYYKFFLQIRKLACSN